MRIRILAVFALISIGLAVAPAVQASTFLYAAAENLGYVYTISPAGVISVFASGLGHPQSLTFDGNGNLFVASYSNYQSNIYEYSPAGSRSTLATVASAQFWGLTIDSAGNLYAGDASGGHIYEFTPGGAMSTFASGIAAAGLAFDTHGNLFAADLSGCIDEFTPAGSKTQFACGLGTSPIGLAFDNGGNLYVADEATNQIYSFTPDGTRTTFASVGSPWALAFDRDGNLFDTSFSTIYKFSPGGSETTFAYVPAAGFYSLAFAPDPVPEPDTVLLIPAALVALVLAGFRRAHRLRGGRTI